MALTEAEREEMAKLVHEVPADQQFIATRSAAHHAVGYCAYSPASEFPDTKYARFYTLLHKALIS